MLLAAFPILKRYGLLTDVTFTDVIVMFIRDRSTHLYGTGLADPTTSRSLWLWLQGGQLPRNTSAVMRTVRELQDSEQDQCK